ncbi:Predicted O-methyltransferase YrrM [Limimonas halophila]|uniref:Predicted O-methyltransferase YrrM n=1 Tax=Limimonas halophila TaxID=1082479 RepID=A0A1G7NSB3_9PROT|nr:class I SAM-dependent methyltransferase [Limimonas halophila]SDF76892.1 Predicted O-methyltransferase YrrM [Limimonas halophila]
MSTRSIGLDDALTAYVHRVGSRETEVLARLREETAARSDAHMQIAPEQGQVMHLLVELMGARSVIEIGTFTGYSTLWMALAMPSDGQILACDVDPEATAIGQRAWRQAGVDDRVELRIAPALETLDALLDDGQAGAHDLAFIDADKERYQAYYERCLQLLRPGGLILADNTLWGGSVVDPAKTDTATEAIRAFNAKLGEDDRVTLAMTPIGDGLTLARKR